MKAPLFADRQEAGRALAAELVRHKWPPDTVVLALPRGGVPVGRAVAQALRAPLDLVIVRKLGVPWQKELAMGAIVGDSFQILDQDLIRRLRISREEVDATVAEERDEWERREKLYRGGRPPLNLRGCTVVLVDDGLATGSTMVVAARYVRSLHPAKLIAAVPVASLEAYERLLAETDQCVCLAAPEPFHAVGEWYANFPQLTDQ